MLRFPLAADQKKLFKGLIIMLIGTMSGVVVVDMQLNSLTRQHEFVQLINLRRDPRDGYFAYFFGNSYPLGAVAPLARLENTGMELLVDAHAAKLTLPTQISFDASRALYWLKLWGRQFVDEAYQTKAALTGFACQAYAKAAEYAEQVWYVLQGESGK